MPRLTLRCAGAAKRVATFAFRACHDVAEGSELCISYVGEAAAEPEERARQVELLGWAYGIPVPPAP